MKLRLSPRGRRRAFTETSDQKFKTPQQQQQQQQLSIFFLGLKYENSV